LFCIEGFELRNADRSSGGCSYRFWMPMSEQRI
jgi:hypothetical protein